MQTADCVEAVDDLQRFYGRREIAEFLRARGFPVASRQLEKMASLGGGPPYRIFARKALYEPNEVLMWAKGRMSSPRHHTSEGRANAA